MVDVAFPGHGGANALADELGDLNALLAVIHPHAHMIAGDNLLRGLHSHTVEFDVPCFARFCCLGTRFCTSAPPTPRHRCELTRSCVNILRVDGRSKVPGFCVHSHVAHCSELADSTHVLPAACSSPAPAVNSAIKASRRASSPGATPSVSVTFSPY